jgi:hypothetical protein
VLVEPQLVIVNESDRDRALRVLQKTEAACLITNSIKAEVTMKPSIKIAELAENEISR